MNAKQSVRLFENPLLEALTHVHPIIPLVMWAPFVIAAYYYAIVVQNISALEFSGVFLFALLVWTFTEYFIHRFLFHFETKSKIGDRLIYLFHGIHHDEPDDATRLVMPPVPAVLIMGLLYVIFSALLPEKYLWVFMGSFTFGYLCYDYIHYATHHFPMTSKVGRYLRKYHLQHHHSKEHSKYGVSNPLWDYVFHTVTGPKKDYK
ncbi:MAG: fatty acid hydroxylase [Bdellovibrio sp. CG12_big_fil_rev_8_21_14_0_65_39_13]|nr:MAG: fatty acid hydroxylase [Bdellovibrio sp. CG22_combo_CG10-13_8_21_14_all_39_27]PIQ62203.1 MAG: fatty acid hydroxylase [Bdellovibrio sp. CG12_big_fil_rev_8_21_14_0_65_39_13]PIR34214.1 MAG: fatty acid hydroxylase [Bdellovibrio sp. CG11_big_fil_rev_8_21_14_0_20_39_38]